MSTPAQREAVAEKLWDLSVRDPETKVAAMKFGDLSPSTKQRLRREADEIIAAHEAAECEAAIGPDRELDARVWVALDDGSLIKRYGIPIGCAPKLSASVDAAMHAFWSALPRHGITTIINPWENVCVEICQRDGGVVATGHAQHAPMAVIAAVLRAVAAMDG